MNQKATRIPKQKIFVVAGPSNESAPYRAESTRQAVAFHVGEVEVREATLDEIIGYAKSGVVIRGLKPAAKEDDGQADAFDENPGVGHAA